ncbi:MAG: serine/threonine protein kinase, partial [Prochlorotrichaceae cyanobacterium]
MKWQSGSRLNQYRIDRVLATGGFGITYQATHLGLGQQVVIKTINDNLRRDPEYNKYLKQFRKEAQTLARLGVLHHPHIVRVSDLFDAPLGGMQVPCLVMDFINGENLFTRIRNTKSPLSEPEALKYIQQVGDALHLVHRSGLVHRDVHPGNIMIYKNKAILIDFGLAGSVTPSILSSQRGGNPAYAPHDQWRGNRAPNLDIYSLGMCLYFALTAETPDPFTAPQIKNPTISDRTNAAIVKAIHLDRKNRPQSIRAWFDLLDLPLSPEALQSLPIPAKPKPQPPAALPASAPIKEPERENPAREPRTPQKSKPQKRKGMAVIAGLICLVLIGIMAALVRRNTLPPPPPPPTNLSLLKFYFP